MPVIKAPNSVALLDDGRFLVLSRSLLRVCSADLVCDKSFPTNGAIDELSPDSLKHLYPTETFALRSGGTSLDGSRSLTTELRNTFWHVVTNPLDGIDSPSPPNHRVVSVIDTKSGQKLFSVHYNPKNQLVEPVLAPDGKKLAFVRGGTLEVYEVP